MVLIYSYHPTPNLNKIAITESLEKRVNIFLDNFPVILHAIMIQQVKYLDLFIKFISIIKII